MTYRRAAALAFTLGLALAAAHPVSAATSSAYVDNQTDNCAWVTVYGAGLMTKYSIVGQPHEVRAHSGWQFKFGSYTEVKVRAEVMADATCTNHHTIADTSRELISRSDESYGMHAVIQVKNGVYAVR